MADMRLDKAADLSAQRSKLLKEEAIPDGLKEAKLKELNKKINYWTKRVRQPFGSLEQVQARETPMQMKTWRRDLPKPW